MSSRSRKAGIFLAAMWLMALIAGCGGGRGEATGTVPSSRVGGTAATGSPIVAGAVTLRCHNDTVYTTTTGASGDWARVIPQAELPCAVRITGGTVGAAPGASANTQTFYSLTSGSGEQVTTNISPLTSLALARAHGAAPDDGWFDGLGNAGRQQLQAGLEAAIGALRTALAGYALPDSFDPFNVSFTAATGNPYDDLLEQLRAAIEDAGSSFEAQLTGFAAGGALPPVADASEPPDTSPGDGDLPDTTLPAGVSGVRLATSGTVGGVAQNASVRDWVGAGAIDVGSVPGLLRESYLVISSPFSSFGLRNVPNAIGTYPCGDTLAQDNPRNIELAYGVGQGYSSVGTAGVTGFSCSITVTSVGSATGSSYAGTLEGHVTARLFKTGAPVNLATSVLVSGHFRLGGN